MEHQDVSPEVAQDNAGTEGEGGKPALRPMSEAPKDRTSILALIRRDLAEFSPHYGMSMPEAYAGLWVVVRHPGLSPNGFDTGWGLAGPFGAGLGPDAYFEGWMPLPPPPTDRGA